MIDFCDFSCYYKTADGKLPVLENLSFRVETGEFFVIAGPSGCGKTTLLKSMLGMVDYYSGNIYVDEISFEDISGKDNVFGYVSQEHTLYPHMTVYENIALPLRVMRTPHEELDMRVRKAAKQLEIDWLLSRKPKQLSGGQHQRVAVARTLARLPKILLMDEPFSDLEPQLRRQLRELVKQLCKIYQCTVLFVTHDLKEAMQTGDRIMVMNKENPVRIFMPEEFERYLLLHGGM